MIGNIHPAECSKPRCQERYEDLERSRAHCAALRRDLAAATSRAERAERERDKLQAFKDWCHSYLDAHGVPHHPPGTHGAEGCRIGDRLDWLFAERNAARGERDRMRDALEQITHHVSQDDYGDVDSFAATLRHVDRAARAALEKANG